MTPLLQIRNLSVHYHTETEEIIALKEINLEVHQGEFVSLVGPSGCGKSTLLSVAAGLLRPTSGQVTLAGEPVTEPSLKAGYMLQQDTLYPWRTILQNCLLGAELARVDLKKAKERATQLLTAYGLGDFLHAYPNQLSGGMRQRAALVRTLTLDPPMLFLDEPFSALDYQTRLTLGDEMKGILRNHNKTVLMVTHDIAEAVALSDRVVILTRRPGQVRSVHQINWPPHITPMKAREDPQFSRYFRAIWEELDVHVGHVT